MGSIADLLGDQLRAGLAQLVDPATEDDATEGCPGLVVEPRNRGTCVIAHAIRP